MYNLSVIILAAGKGSRLLRDLHQENKSSKINLPKPLQPFCGKPIIEWLIESLNGCLSENTPIYVVVGSNQIPFYYLSEKYGRGKIRFCTQFVADGTGGAVKVAVNTFFMQPQYLLDATIVQQDKVLICPGDVPFIHPETIVNFINSAEKYNHKLSVLGLILENPFGYGRLQLSDENLTLESIIEEKDCSEQEKRITFCNSGFILANVNYLRDDLLPHLTKENNVQNEYYLTDCVAIARNQCSDNNIGCYPCAQGISSDNYFFRGINTLQDLQSLESKFIQNKNN